MRIQTANKLILSLAGIVAIAPFLILFWQKPVPVEFARPIPHVALKGDRLVTICILDGPTGRICLGPMTREEANTYQDAEPEVYSFGSADYADALAEMRLADALVEIPSDTFRVSPATVASLVKRASHFSSASLDFP